jgi:hypothetical protein
LSGSHLANAVLISRHVVGLIRRADVGSSGLERLVYRHGVQAIGWSFLKRLNDRVRSPGLVDMAAIPAILSRPFDEHRQVAMDAYVGNPPAKGPLAFFKSQTDTTPFLATAMINSFGLQKNPAVLALNVSSAAEAFPREKLFAYLTQHAPQI